MPAAEWSRGLLTNEMEVNVLSAFFASVFASKTSLQECQLSETKGKVQSKEDLPLMEENHVREHLNELYVRKSMGIDRLHPKMLRLVSLKRHFQLSLKGHGNWGRFLKTGREQMSLLSSRWERKIQETASWSVLSQSLGR